MTGVEVASVTLWLGLRNSDDQGTNFDGRVEVYGGMRALEPPASGLLRCIKHVTGNPAGAQEVKVPVRAISWLSR